MSAAQAWLVYILRRMGAAGRLALALALLGLLFHAFVWLPVVMRDRALSREAAVLNDRLKAADQATANADDAEDPLTRFYRVFPPALVALTSLGKIYGHAQARGLNLDRGEYRLIDDGAGRIVGYQADLPIKGSYVQIRQFLAAVLADLPFVALEEMAFERRRISDAMIEAKVRLTLYIARDA